MPRSAKVRIRPKLLTCPHSRLHPTRPSSVRVKEGVEQRGAEVGLAWELSSYPSLGFEWSHAAGSNSRYRCGKCRDQRRPRVRQGNPKQRQLSWRLPQRSVSRGNFSKIDFDETMMMGVKVLALARETSKTEVREVVTLPRNKSVVTFGTGTNARMSRSRISQSKEAPSLSSPEARSHAPSQSSPVAARLRPSQPVAARRSPSQPVL